MKKCLPIAIMVLLLLLASGVSATVTAYQFVERDADCANEPQWTSYQVTTLISSWSACNKGEKYRQDNVSSYSELVMGYLSNSGYTVPTMVTGQATGNDISLKAKNADATWDIKLVEVNPSTEAIISTLDTKTVVVTGGNTDIITDISELTGIVAAGNTFGILLAVTPSSPDRAEIKWGSYERAGKRVLINVDEVALYPTPAFGILAVYESSTTTLDDGTAICTGLDIGNGGGDSCGTDLTPGNTYQFQVEVETTNDDFNATNFDFQSAVGSSHVLGGVTAADITCGCWDDGTHITGTDAVSTTTATCTFSGTLCGSEVAGFEDFYFIITVASDATASDSTSSFYTSDGNYTATSDNITWTVIPEYTLITLIITVSLAAIAFFTLRARNDSNRK